MNKFVSDRDTIVALATPEGNSALGVVRIDGPDSFKIASKLSDKSDSVLNANGNTVLLSKILDDKNHILDQAVFTFWRSPKSYTGNNLVELSCHGGTKVLSNVLNRILELGARAADAGEFSQRAFINGKLSLDKAEAVSSLIHAKTESAAKIAARMLDFGVKDKLEDIKNELVSILARVEIGLDFIEEDLDEEVAAVSAQRLVELAKELQRIADHYKASKYLRDGANIVIAGAPNVGKSTLLNHFAGYDRAIVSDIPGTTRDYIEIQIDWNGIPVRLYDTAGFRESSDKIEEEGTQRAFSLLKTADKVIWLTTSPDFTLPSEEVFSNQNVIIAINKIDIFETPKLEINSDIRNRPHELISAKTGKNIQNLINRITEEFLSGYNFENLMILEKRHADLLNSSANCILRSITDNTTMELEFLAADLHESLNLLGQITGEFTSEDLLNRIFSNFCIGK